MASRTEGDNPAVQRLRLSEWARRQGISRLTAYRMLQAGTLPVPAERTPTGRWFVVVNTESRAAVYARGDSEADADEINEQIASVVGWASSRNLPIYTVIREIADPEQGPLPLLARLLDDQRYTQVLVATPEVVGRRAFELLNAALRRHGRSMVAIDRTASAG